MPVTAANIPPELFPRIIHFVSTDARGEWHSDSDRALQNCSLVCAFWAEKARRMLHHERVIMIGSRLQAELFRQVVITTGSKRLTPVITLIAGIDVLVYLGLDARSWHHILGLLVPLIPAEKFHHLSIDGTPSFSPKKLRTPHWTVPAPLCRSITPYKALYLHGSRFESINDVLMLCSHFPRVERLYLAQLTWNVDSNAHGASRTQVANTHGHGVLSSMYLKGCPDNTLLLCQLLQSGPQRTFMHALSGADQAVVISLLEGITAAYSTTFGGKKAVILFKSIHNGTRE